MRPGSGHIPFHMAESDSPIPQGRRPKRDLESARRRMQRRILADWRGVYIPPDLSGYERKVGDVVGRILQRAGVADRPAHEEIAADWAAMVGDFLSRHSRPVALRRGVLQVAVVQAAVRYDLERRHKRDILERLQAQYGPAKVKDVKFLNG